LIAEGSPEHVATVADSHTGVFLRPLLGLEPTIRT
jgi:excinuclease UvrABC ATPase subunit